MLFYKDRTWHLCTERVKYIQHGEEIEQYVGSEGRDWWINFAEKWEHTKILEFIEIKPTQEQLDKFGEILQLDIPEGFGTELIDYIERGVFPEGINHILRPLQMIKEQRDQDEYLIDQDFRLSLMEMGVDANDL